MIDIKVVTTDTLVWGASLCWEKKSLLVLFHHLKAGFLLNGTLSKYFYGKPIGTSGVKVGAELG